MMTTLADRCRSGSSSGGREHSSARDRSVAFGANARVCVRCARCAHCRNNAMRAAAIMQPNWNWRVTLQQHHQHDTTMQVQAAPALGCCCVLRLCAALPLLLLQAPLGALLRLPLRRGAPS